MKIAAGAGQPLPEHDLLLVAAAQQPHGCVASPSRAARRRSAPPCRLRTARQHADAREPPSVRQRDVARDGQAGDEPLRLAILGQQPMPRAIASAGMRNAAPGRRRAAAAVERSAPAMTRASSVRPAPSSPRSRALRPRAAKS
jgi:hypothetical protein